ncbi:MAG: hypothetical protein HFH75_01595 [Lachnospiraceae bacterium]|jgi:hypothetical protein|nr:hypothetical protein [Lachnospiraceae bacterium]MCI8966265.1 hypothetical protein [Lachnospiraceae bacterium]MDE6942429.1 hypothetical protein [Lachnospiraceae bacterium]MDE7000408.1 hypothetical protein [Lachnospiraceae bacterium]
MDFFDRTTKVVREIGNVTKEQTELANLKIQKAAVEKKLESQYAEIGKRYVAYIADSFRTTPFDVSDILDAINPDLEKVSEITEQISQKDQQVRQHSIEKDRKKALDQFESERRKLDKARDLDVITYEEYEEKLAKAQKKFDNFEMLKKIQMQYEMDIITREEYEEKVRNVLQ